MEHACTDCRSDRGNVLPVMLALALVIIAVAVALMPAAFGITYRANAQTAADAAAVAGAQELRTQLVYGDYTQRVDNLDHTKVCGTAADYAERNDAVLVEGSCDVQQGDDGFFVTVAVQNARPVDTDPTSGSAAQSDQNQDVGAVARARINPGSFSGGGSGGGSGSWSGQPELLPDAPETVEDRFVQMVEYMHEVDKLNLVYEWGGGHCCTPAEPQWGPFDCSGAVSAAMQYGAGYDVHTAVSGQMVNAGEPGASPSGKGVTIYAYDGHVFMVAGGRGWGTGSAPNAGAGWLSYNTPYHSLFEGRHFPEFEELDPEWVDDVMRDVTGEGGLPDDPGALSAGGAANVELVPVED